MSPVVALILHCADYQGQICSGNLLFSRAVTSQVPSAACVLTVVFGMGTRVSHRRIVTGNFLGFPAVFLLYFRLRRKRRMNPALNPTAFMGSVAALFSRYLNPQN